MISLVNFSSPSFATSSWSKSELPQYVFQSLSLCPRLLFFLPLSGGFVVLNFASFFPMYFFWAFNSLIYTLTLRGTGIFRPLYENITVLGAFIITIGSSADIFFGYELPEDFQILGLVGWLLLVVGTSLGNYFAWGDKTTSSNEME